MMAMGHQSNKGKTMKSGTNTEDASHSKLIETAQLVKRAIEEKKEQRAALLVERKKIDQQRAELLGKVVPMSDFKQFLIDYIEAKRTEYLASLRTAIEGVLYPPRRGNVLPVHERKPLNFQEMEALVKPDGEAGITAFGRVQLVQPNKLYFDDLGFYFYFGRLIQQQIAENFDGLGLSYRNVTSDEIGGDRATIRAQLIALDEKQAALTNDIARLHKEIVELGGRIIGE